jgi:tetratricopeptide (TPR) repeat protein
MASDLHGAPTPLALSSIFSPTIPQSSLAQKSPLASSHSSTNDIQIVEPPGGENSKTKLGVDLEQRSLIPPLKAGLDSTEWTDLCLQGEAFIKQHRYDEARQCFLSCLSKEPGSTRAQYRMACLEANAGQLNEAQKWAEQALNHDPLRSEVHYILALIYEVQGDLREAIARLKKVIYLDPYFILAHFGLFHLYQRTGNPIEAERHRTLSVHLASKLSSDTVLPGSDDLTAGQLLNMAQAVSNHRVIMSRGKS